MAPHTDAPDPPRHRSALLAARRWASRLERERNVVSINKQRWAFAIIGFVMATNVSAKDVAGLFLGAFILSGSLVGLIVGVVSPLLKALKFLRGGVLAVGLSLIPWASLLLYWDFPFPDKTLTGNLPFMLFVLIGTVPVYLVVYGLVWVFVPKEHPHDEKGSLSNDTVERDARKNGARPSP